MADPFDTDGDGQMNVSETNAKVTIEEAFKRFDEDASGFIDAAELTALIESLDVDGDMSSEEVEKAMGELDADGSGRIEKNEFIQWWLDMNGSGDSDSALRKRLRNLAKQGRKRLGTDIHKASWEGNLDVVQAFITTNGTLVNAKDETDHADSYRPLHYAAYQGHKEICRYLLSKRADINAQTELGCTALFFASQQGRESIVKLLLNHRASAALVESECGLGPVDVADTDAIRALFRSIGKYRRPESPIDIVASVMSSTSSSSKTKTKKRNSKDKNGVLVSVEWIHDETKSRRSADEILPVSGFIVRALDSETGEIVKEIDIPKSDDEDGVDDEHYLIRVRLLGGKKYVFQIAAVNGLGRSKFSQESDVVRVGTRPIGMVPRPVVGEIHPTSVLLTWDEVDMTTPEEEGGEKTKWMVETQRVSDSNAWMERERGTSSTTSVPRPTQSVFKHATETASGSDTFVTLDRLTTGSRYRARVYLRNESGSGNPGDYVEFETPMFEGSSTRRGGSRSKGSSRIGSLGRSSEEKMSGGGERVEEERFAVHHRGE